MAEHDGRDAAPPHYNQPREVVDQVRDQRDDVTFAAFCDDTAFIYEARAGRKGDPVGDHNKAKWWRQMADHVRGLAPDPRAARPNFIPYRRISPGSAVLCDLGEGVVIPGIVENVSASTPHRLLVLVVCAGGHKVEELHRGDVIPDADTCDCRRTA